MPRTEVIQIVNTNLPEIHDSCINLLVGECIEPDFFTYQFIEKADFPAVRLGLLPGPVVVRFAEKAWKITGRAKDETTTNTNFCLVRSGVGSGAKRSGKPV